MYVGHLIQEVLPQIASLLLRTSTIDESQNLNGYFVGVDCGTNPYILKADEKINDIKMSLERLGCMRDGVSMNEYRLYAHVSLDV